MTIYEIITQRILDRLEQAKTDNKKFHWIKPWTGGPPCAVSYTTGKPYKGINRLILEPGNEYLTYKAIQEINESLPEDEKLFVKKGAKALPVFFYSTYDVKDENGNPVLDEYGEPAKKWYCKYYNVFNREDVGNAHAHFPAEKNVHTTSKQTKLLDKYIQAYAKAKGLTVDVVEDGANCFYDPENHMVRVPDKAGFTSLYAYYSAILHELIHSTSKGLNRFLGRDFGSTAYCREELVAQIGSQMLLNHFQIVCDEAEEENDIAYIDGWVSHLKEHTKEISRAASQAEKAAQYFMDVAETEINKKKRKAS